RLLLEFSGTEVRYPVEKLVHERFEQQAERTPNRVATVDESTALTFAQLNAKANAVAWTLRDQHSVRPGTIVGLAMNRSVEMVIGILGILKAGGVYLPINIHDPLARINSILQDSGCNI